MVATPALAQVPPGVEVGGKLSKRAASAFVHRTLPPWAPNGLLQDERAAFYDAAKYRGRGSTRVGRSQVDVRYMVVLRARPEREMDGWLPIRCSGVMRAARLTNGGLTGVSRDYRCVTVFPRG